MTDRAEGYLWDGSDPIDPDVQRMEAMLSIFSSSAASQPGDEDFLDDLPVHDDLPTLSPASEPRSSSRSYAVGWMMAASFLVVLALSAIVKLSEDGPASADVPMVRADDVASTETRSVAAPADPRSASEVLASVRAYYRSANDLTADFAQTYRNPVYGTKTRSHGTLRVKKPGMMVWDYAGAGAADFYLAHRRLRVVEHDLRQVVSHRAQEAEFAAIPTVLLGRRNWTKAFRVRVANARLTEVYGQPGHTVIELAPKKRSPHYKALLLVVDDPTGRVDGFVVRNADGSINEFVLSDVRRNRGLADEAFELTVPAGYVEVQG